MWVEMIEKELPRGKETREKRGSKHVGMWGKLCILLSRWQGEME